MHKLILAVVATAMLLASCSSTVDDAPLYTACRAVVVAEQLLRPLRPQMTEAQISTVATTVRLARVICLKPVKDLKDPVAAAAAVSRYIGVLSTVKKELVL